MDFQSQDLRRSSILMKPPHTALNTLHAERASFSVFTQRAPGSPEEKTSPMSRINTPAIRNAHEAYRGEVYAQIQRRPLRRIYCPAPPPPSAPRRPHALKGHAERQRRAGHCGFSQPAGAGDLSSCPPARPSGYDTCVAARNVDRQAHPTGSGNPQQIRAGEPTGVISTTPWSFVKILWPEARGTISEARVLGHPIAPDTPMSSSSISAWPSAVITYTSPITSTTPPGFPGGYLEPRLGLHHRRLAAAAMENCTAEAMKRRLSKSILDASVGVAAWGPHLRLPPRSAPRWSSSSPCSATRNGSSTKPRCSSPTSATDR